MTFQSQFKTNSRMCRNGTRENCPVKKCHFQHSMAARIIYSSAPKGAVPPPPTPVTSPIGPYFPSATQGARGWCGDGKIHAQHIRSAVENAVLVQGSRSCHRSVLSRRAYLLADPRARRAIYSRKDRFLDHHYATQSRYVVQDDAMSAFHPKPWMVPLGRPLLLHSRSRVGVGALVGTRLVQSLHPRLRHDWRT
ncbi:hypothetical protein EI94DRAFT_472705 [Lactarius quietus]|nr:hypothetical protein EI94DRAFT_472705 [Lactarius quietus]